MNLFQDLNRDQTSIKSDQHGPRVGEPLIIETTYQIQWRESKSCSKEAGKTTLNGAYIPTD